MSDATAPPPRKKRSILKIILIALLLLVAVFLGVVAMQPNTYVVERSATISAPQEKVFSQVNDFHNWAEWSPWAKLDPNAKNTFEGPSAGKDAVFRWAGNDQVGEGDMIITESRPNDYIHIKLHFIKPFEDTADTEFLFKPEGDKTAVTWKMSGKHNFISKAMCLVMSMDKMIGTDFEKGLASMKTIVEAPPKS